MRIFILFLSSLLHSLLGLRAGEFEPTFNPGTASLGADWHVPWHDQFPPANPLITSIYSVSIGCGAEDIQNMASHSGTDDQRDCTGLSPLGLPLTSALRGGFDCLGVPDGTALPGTPCDDANEATTNDTYTIDCDCIGDAVSCSQPTLNTGIAPGATASISGSLPSGSSDLWYTIQLFGCNDVLVRTCFNSSVNYFAPGWFTTCPTSQDAFTYYQDTIPNECGGMDFVLSGLAGGLYYLALNAMGGPYHFDVITFSCEPPDCLGTNGGSALPGTACDDLDPGTGPDLWTEQCECIGEQIVILDCLGVPNGEALPGTPCNDGIPSTTNDAFDLNCECNGYDCAGEQGGSALPGSFCDDGLSWTYNDFWGPDCNCTGSGIIGIAETPGSTSILSLRPNPSSGEDVIVTLQLSNRINGVLNLIDAVGRVIWSYPVEQEVGDVRVSIPTARSAPGPYVVQWTSVGSVMSQRLIIQ